jgi:hypothetical protein
MIRFSYKMTCFVVIMHRNVAEASHFVLLCGYFGAETIYGADTPITIDGRKAGENRGLGERHWAKPHNDHTTIS